MAQHSSRLHRLLTLLDTGSTQVTRLTAARQIGDIAKTHPQDLNSLLKKVSQYLRSKNWGTRVAAAHAIGSIAENVKHATLKELSERIERELSAVGVNDHVKEKMMMECSNYDFSSAMALTFRSFDIAKVLEFGPPLLASVGQEYDLAMDNKNSAERLARQKQNLRRQLGFLGTERRFQARYGKRLLAAKDPKCSAKDAEAGILAMEALHKQVMSFLLRCTKDEVLSDLPEKIVQDRYCDLSPIQLKLYEQFSGSDTKNEISTLVVGETPTSGEAPSVSPKASSHVFQAIQYLLKLCSHPLLVLGEKPRYDSEGSIRTNA